MSLLERYGAGAGPAGPVAAPAAPAADVVDVVAAELGRTAPAPVDELERPRCAGCEWRDAAPCPFRGGFACSELERLRRLKRDSLAAPSELERLEELERELEPAPAPVADELETLAADIRGRTVGAPAPVADPAPAPAPAPAAAASRGRTDKAPRRERRERKPRPAPVREAALAAAAQLDALGIPHNAVTGEAYRGKNVARVLEAEAAHGFGAGGWAGFWQWRDIGRTVRKGEHAACRIMVVYGSSSSTDDVREADDGGPELARSSRRSGRGVGGKAIFHYDQTEEYTAPDGAESEQTS